MLTGNKWRPSFVMAIKDNTLVLRANIEKIDSILSVRLKTLTFSEN